MQLRPDGSYRYFLPSQRFSSTDPGLGSYQSYRIGSQVYLDFGSTEFLWRFDANAPISEVKETPAKDLGIFYPNPSRSRIIRYEGDEVLQDLYVWDVSGRKVCSHSTLFPGDALVLPDNMIAGIYHPGLPRRYVPPRLSVGESHWNKNGEIGKLNWVRASRTSHKTDNLLLAEKVEMLRKLSIDNPTPNDILAALDVAVQEVIEAEIEKAQAELPPPCFKAYWETYIEENAYRWNLYWKPNQESALKVFAEFHPKALPFADIDNKLLNRFERWRLENSRSKTTIAKELSNLRAVYNGAVRNKLASFADNPFNSYVIKHGVGEERVAFTWKEIDLIEGDTQVSKEEALSRDVFLFQFYGGGRRINEVLTLTWNDVGADSFTYYQLKKGKRVRVSRELIAESRAILARYEHRRSAGSRYVFPVYADDADLMQKIVRTTAVGAVNDGLTSMAERLGLLHFSSHVARHSWTELARKSKVDVYGISKNLGHSKLAVTEVYMADFDQVAVETAHRAMIASRPIKEATNGPEMVA